MNKNIEITIFSDGKSIGGTDNTSDIEEDLKNDSLFGEEFKEMPLEDKKQWIVEELTSQINDEIKRIFNNLELLNN
jgi:hypothetical protein